MIEIEEHPDVPSATWSKLVQDTGGNPLHMPQVLHGEHSPSDLSYCVFLESGTPVGCTVGVTKRASRLKVFPGKRSFFIPTAISIADSATGDEAAIYESFLRFLAERSYDELMIGPTWGRDFSEDRVLSPWITERFVDFTIDLTQSNEQLMAGMRKNHRRNVRIAIKKGVAVNQDTTLSAFLKLRDIQTESAQRGRERGNPFQVQSESYYRSIFEAIYKQSLGMIVIAYAEDDAVSAASYVVHGKYAMESRSASSRRGYETCSAYLIKHAALDLLRDEGVEVLNLSAVPAAASDSDHPQHGLFEFKAGFGGQSNIRTSVQIPIKEAVSGLSSHPPGVR